MAFDCNKLSAALLFFEADVLKVAASSVLEKMVLNAEIAELRQMLQRGHERTVIFPRVCAGQTHLVFLNRRETASDSLSNLGASFVQDRCERRDSCEKRIA